MKALLLAPFTQQIRAAKAYCFFPSPPISIFRKSIYFFATYPRLKKFAALPTSLPSIDNLNWFQAVDFRRIRGFFISKDPLCTIRENRREEVGGGENKVGG